MNDHNHDQINEPTAVTVADPQQDGAVAKNPFSGEGYRLNSPVGRMARIADYMNHERVLGTLRAVIPQNCQAFVASVLNEIRKTAGDEKKDLTLCDPQSIVNCCIDAAKLRLGIDGRQHAHLVKRKNNATLQIGYRGYLARLGEGLQGFVPVVECVYKDDQVKVSRVGDVATVEHTPHEPFGARRDDDIIGAYAYLSWESSPGHRTSVVETINLATINKIKNAAETKAIWNLWFTEKVKVAVIRRACKFHFSAITNDLDQHDNRDFDLDTMTEAADRPSAARRIGAGLKAVNGEATT